MEETISQEILNVIDGFDFHTLNPGSGDTLLTRKETKFLLTPFQALSLLYEIQPISSVLEVANQRFCHYRNTYFDTEQHTCYLNHLHGRGNRLKIRMRSYLDSGAHFIEVKRNTSGKMGMKSRTAANPDLDISAYQEFLRANSVPYRQSLQPSLRNSYARLSIQNSDGERLTLDHQLTFERIDDYGFCCALPGLIVVELKQTKLSRRSAYYRALKRLGARPSSFSKYCIGMLLTTGENDPLPYNRLKPQLRKVERFGGVVFPELPTLEELCDDSVIDVEVPAEFPVDTDPSQPLYGKVS